MPPSKDRTTLTAGERMPASVPLTIAVERPEQFSPGLDPELIALIQETPKT
jgi:Mn-containing catalase